MRQSERWLIPFITLNKYCKNTFNLAEVAKSKTVHYDDDKKDTHNYGGLFLDKYTVENSNNRRKSIYRNPMMTRQSRELYMYIVDFMPIGTGCIVLHTEELAKDLSISKGKILESIKILTELNVLDRINYSPPVYSVNPKYAFRGNLLQFLIDNYPKHLEVKQVRFINGKWKVNFRPYLKKSMFQV